jgi:hypothetical protein
MYQRLRAKGFRPTIDTFQTNIRGLWAVGGRNNGRTWALENFTGDLFVNEESVTLAVIAHSSDADGQRQLWPFSVDYFKDSDTLSLNFLGEAFISENASKPNEKVQIRYDSEAPGKLLILTRTLILFSQTVIFPNSYLTTEPR